MNYMVSVCPTIIQFGSMRIMKLIQSIMRNSASHPGVRGLGRLDGCACNVLSSQNMHENINPAVASTFVVHSTRWETRFLNYPWRGHLLGKLLLLSTLHAWTPCHWHRSQKFATDARRYLETCRFITKDGCCSSQTYTDEPSENICISKIWAIQILAKYIINGQWRLLPNPSLITGCWGFIQGKQHWAGKWSLASQLHSRQPFSANAKTRLCMRSSFSSTRMVRFWKKQELREHTIMGRSGKVNWESNEIKGTIQKCDKQTHAQKFSQTKSQHANVFCPNYETSTHCTL